MSYNEDDFRPSLMSEMNRRAKKDMNKTFGLSNLTEYVDANGRRVCLGDWIRFLWWVPCSDGTQREKYIYGRILKRHGKLIFKYRDHFVKAGETYDGPRYHERRLDALNFDSTMEWEIVDDIRHYGVYMPANATRTIKQD